jgi:hypothetical protein
MHGLLAPLDLALEGLARERLWGGDPEDLLVVDAPQRGVINDRLAPGTCGTRRWKQETATEASEPGSGTRSKSRMNRPIGERVATMTN